MARNLAGSPIQKYCEILDEFVKIRIFTDDDIAELLRSRSVQNRTAYQQMVVNACIVNFQDEIVPLFKSKNRIPCKTSALEELLYQICVEVNPLLEIHQVSLPVADDAGECGQLHLLTQPGLRNQKASKRDLDRVEADLRRAVIGQDAAIDSVVKSFRKAAAGIKDPRRPIGVFLLVGSTGTGKTELAKMAARHLFGDSTRMVRIDCSEYALPHEYAKLIGAPPGYVGHNEGGQLTEQMKEKKAGVVLFDEIEKAHKKVHNLLLQIMDEGFLTDSKGQIVPFNKSFILMTSNVGVEEIHSIRDRVGFDWKARVNVGRDQVKEATIEAMKHAFRPEFINRLDGVLVFNALTKAHCERIAKNQLALVASYLKESGIELEFAPSVARQVAHQGFNPEYGARELRRIIQAQIEEPLSEQILRSEFRVGDRVRVIARGERFSAHRVARARPVRHRSATPPAIDRIDSTDSHSEHLAPA
ncbi:MAG: ATP-dependent Clp protease ATP-binding subunit [Planctomycetes bacterium]|nr:ATP-dependent Clp protease ATP-binding subunit [Planctomycetota bacterium]